MWGDRCGGLGIVFLTGTCRREIAGNFGGRIEIRTEVGSFKGSRARKSAVGKRLGKGLNDIKRWEVGRFGLKEYLPKLQGLGDFFEENGEAGTFLEKE